MKSIVVGTAGHIDHGKSALVRALTGTDPDRLKEEQERGITIDLGFAHMQAGDLDVAFVDVPGHERFVKNMLAGAGGIDLVLLVVAADESVMPQTREHFQICRLLGIRAGVVALTKSDAADADMRELAALEVRELTAGSFLENAPLVEVSAKTGAGLDALRAAIREAAGSVGRAGQAGAARLPIDRVFSVKGFGTVVTGTLLAGTLREEQPLAVLPAGRPVRVRGLQVHGERQPAAGAGRRVAVNLSGVEVPDLARGDTLAEPGSLDATRRLDVAFELLKDARPLRHGARIRFHQGTSEVLGRIAIARVEGQDGVADVPPGGRALARLRLEAAAVLTRGDRFILRAYSPTVTIGGGTVLDPLPPRGAIRTAAGRARLERLAAGGIDAAVETFVEGAGAAGLHTRALVSRAGLPPPEVSATARRLVETGRVTAVGELLVSSGVVERLTAGLLAAIGAHHQKEPLSDGLPREEARERVFGRAAPSLFEFVLDRLSERKQIVARDRLASATHRVALSPEDARAQEEIERVFRQAGLAPPDVAAAAAGARVAPPTAERVVALLVRQKRLVRVDTLLFHADALNGLKADVRTMKNGRVDVAAFKERYGISRKYAIPLLEYLDRERVTRRLGDARVVLP